MRQAKLYHYTIPVETGVILRHRRLKQREGLLVQLLDNGRQGWGEIAPLPEFSREVLATATEQARHCLQLWRNAQPLELDDFSPSVEFGVSCALAELDGRLELAGNFDTAPLCYGDPDELYAKLTTMKGQKIAKMKVGLYEANRDGLIAEMFLAAIPDLKLRLDANRAWTLEKAAQFASKISPEYRQRIQFIEEPCQTPELSRQFAAQHQIAIAWDETVREADFIAKEEPNLTALVLKPSLYGSLEKCICLITQAHQKGLMVVISSSIESSFGLTQLARIAQQYTPDTLPGLDTLGLMKTQLIRAYQGSTLPVADLNSEYICEIAI